jgi:hypothetical protein
MKKRSSDEPRIERVPMPPPAPSLADRLAVTKMARCEVCGQPRSSRNSSDQLCWVCRRLKISAWRDVDKLSLPE